MKKTVILLMILLVSGCSNISEKEVIQAFQTTPGTTATTSAEAASPITEEITKRTEENITEQTAETTEQTTAETAEPPTETETIPEYAEIGENGVLVIKRNGHFMGLMPCWGTYELCESYASNINKFAERLPNVRVYSMVVPTSSEFFVPEGIKNFTSSQEDKAKHIAERLKNVINIDVYPAIKEHVYGEELYSRTDHHWLPLGAYYAAKEFAAAAGFTVPALSECEKVVKSGYVGSMYYYSKDENIKNDPEDFVMYIPPMKTETAYYDTGFKNPREGSLFTTPDGSAYYCSFLGSDDRIAKIETQAKTGRVLVIFKESFGNAIVPFVTSGFDTIYVCDVRYFDLNAVSFCKNAGATDLLFASCTFTPAGVNQKYYAKILG